MYQNVIRRQLRAAVIAAGALALGATVAGADTVDCQRAIVKGAEVRQHPHQGAAECERAG
jgi:hypothetical protein